LGKAKVTVGKRGENESWQKAMEIWIRICHIQFGNVKEENPRSSSCHADFYSQISIIFPKECKTDF